MQTDTPNKFNNKIWNKNKYFLSKLTTMGASSSAQERKASVKSDAMQD